MNAQNIENYILCSKTNGFPAGIPCSGGGYIKFQALKSRILGNYGFNSSFSTKLLINRLEKINPDIIHIHNIHGWYLNLPIFWEYMRKHTEIKFPRGR